MEPKNQDTTILHNVEAYKSKFSGVLHGKSVIRELNFRKISLDVA